MKKSNGISKNFKVARVSKIIVPQGKEPREVNVLALMESLEQVGVMDNPITIDMSNCLICGIDRFEAAKRLQWEKVPVIYFHGNEIEKQLLSLDENLIRKVFSKIDLGEMLLERDRLLEQMGKKTQIGTNQHSNKNSRDIVKTTSELAAEIKVSVSKYRQVKKIARDITQYNREKLKNTGYAENTTGLLKLSQEPPEVQDRVVNSLLEYSRFSQATETPLTMKRQIHKTKNELERETILENIEVTNNQSDLKHSKIDLSQYGLSIYHSDFQDIVDDIPDHSLDMILTDPIYMREYHHLYEKIAMIGKEKLREGGLCLMYIENHHLGKIHKLVSPYLEYYMLFILTNNDFFRRLPFTQINPRYRPVLGMVKGKIGERHGTIDDILPTSKPEKKHHPWQQDVGPQIRLIEHFTKVGGTVFDPMGGSMTTGVACLHTGRKFIGAEIDKDNFLLGKHRLEEDVIQLVKITPNAA